MAIKKFPQETQQITPEEKNLILETLSKHVPFDKDQKNRPENERQQIKQEENNDLRLRVNMGMFRGDIELYRDILVFNNTSGKEVEEYMTEDDSYLYTQDIEQAYRAFDLLYQGYSKRFVYKIIRLRQESNT